MGGPLSNKRHEPKMDDKDSVYISLIHSKAENYNLAMRANDQDLLNRRDEVHRLLSPHLIIELCNAWKKLQQIQKEEEALELEELGE